MLSEYDERVKDYRKKSHDIYIVKMIQHKGLEDKVEKLITMPLHLGAFVSSNSKRNMNNFILLLMDFMQRMILRRYRFTIF